MARGYTIRINVITSGARKSSKNIRELSGAGAQAAKGLNLAKTAAVGLGAVFASSLVRSVARTGIEFEQLQARLKDPAAFAQIKEFAKNTPFQLSQVADSYIKLRNLGIDPTMERMSAFGNIAAAQGKSMQQFAEAVADAATNEFERLKEFGIKARQEGENVTFTFQGVSKTVKKNSSEIVGYLKEIGETKFATAMSDQMQTTAGMISNLKDQAAELANAFWEGGMKDATQALIGALSRLTGVVQAFNTHTGGLKGTFKGLESLMAEAGAALFDVLGDEEVSNNLRRIANEAAKAFYNIKEGTDDVGNAATKAAPKVDGLAASLSGAGDEASKLQDEFENAIQSLIDSAKTETERAEEDFNEAGVLMAKALADGLVDEATMKKVMDHYSTLMGEARAAAGDFDASATNNKDPELKGTADNTRQIKTDWESISYAIADTINSLNDGTADWLDYLNAAVSLWEDIARAAGSASGGGGASGKGQSSGASSSDAASSLGQYAGYANAAIAIYTAVFDYVDALVERKKAQRYSLPITTGAVGVSSFGGQAIGSDNFADSTEVAHIQEGLARGLEAILGVIGGFVTDIDEFGVQIQQSGEKFKAIAGDTVIGVFDSMQEATEQAMKFALKRADFEGIGENMALALARSSKVTLEGFLSDLNLARTLDDIGLTDLDITLRDLSRSSLQAAEGARRLGLDVDAALDIFSTQAQDIRDRITGNSKTQYERDLADMDAFNRQIQDRIEQLKRYMESLAGVADPNFGPSAGGGGGDGGRVGPGGGGFGDSSNFDYGDLWRTNLGGLGDAFGTLGTSALFATAGSETLMASVQGLGDAAVAVANGAVSPAIQAILDEIGELEGMLIGEDEIKKNKGGNGASRREAIARLNDEIERLGRVSGGPVTEALFAVNDNFDRLEEEARRLRQPLEEIVALRERESEALKDQARDSFVVDWVLWLNDFGEVEQAMQRFGGEADAMKDQIRDLGEAGVISAESMEELLAAVDPVAWKKAAKFSQGFANDLLLDLYDYLGEDVAAAELRWTLQKAELVARQEQLRIALAAGHITQELFDDIADRMEDVLSMPNPFLDDDGGGDPDEEDDGISYGTNPAIAEMVAGWREDLARAISRSYPDVAAALSAFQDLYDSTSGHLADEIMAGFNEVLDAIQVALIQPIKDLRDEILKDELGPLSSRDRLEAAQQEYLSTLEAAQGGDLEAFQNFDDVAREYRELYQAFYGNAASGFLDAQILSAIAQLETLDLEGTLSGGQLGVDVLLGSGGPVNTSLERGFTMLDGHGVDQLNELRSIRNSLERIEGGRGGGGQSFGRRLTRTGTDG